VADTVHIQVQMATLTLNVAALAEAVQGAVRLNMVLNLLIPLLVMQVVMVSML